MYGYDPIFLEKRKLNEWLDESEENIVLIFDKNSLKFSASPNDSMKNNSQDKIFCLKKQFLFNPEIKDIFVKCALENGQIMVKKTYSSKNLYNNIGYYINKNVLLDIKSIKPSLFNKRVFKVSIATETTDQWQAEGENMYISKEMLALSKIGLFKNKKIKIDAQTKDGVQDTKLDTKLDRKNIPYKEDVYFEKLLSKALYDYSFKWDGPINAYLRYGEAYFFTSIFNQTYRVYGDTKDSAREAIINKIADLDRAFLEAAPRHEDSAKIYYRGMKQPFENLVKEGDSITVQNYMSITTKLVIGVGFSGIKKVGKDLVNSCCLYKILISNGVPYINMINTTKYKAENETLLPRNLKLTFIKKTTLPYQLYGEIPVIVIKVSLQNNDQFKIHSGCKKFYLGKLIHLDTNSINTKVIPEKVIREKVIREKVIPEKVIPEKVIRDKKKSTKKQTTNLKRCPNGTRKNKISGICEPITTNSIKKENQIVKQKTKSKRCPNGTRKNKISGLCEKITEI